MPTLNPPRGSSSRCHCSDQRGSAVKVRNLGRYARQSLSQDPGQAHERGIDVKIRKRAPLCAIDLIDARARRQEPSERLLACHDHAPAARLAPAVHNG